MKSIALKLWIALIIYTVIYTILFGKEGSLLPLMLQGKADPFAQNFFNLMGLVPLYFLFDYFLNIQKSRKNFLPFMLGFFGGAYAILFGYMKHKSHLKTLKVWHKIFLIVLILSTLTVMMLGFLNGQPQVYLEAFFSDPMVGIMLVDFFILYTWSIIRAYQQYQDWYVSFIPMLGFGMVMLRSKRRE